MDTFTTDPEARVAEQIVKGLDWSEIIALGANLDNLPPALRTAFLEDQERCMERVLKRYHDRTRFMSDFD